jgi:hypothetical protein
VAGRTGGDRRVAALERLAVDALCVILGLVVVAHRAVDPLERGVMREILDVAEIEMAIHAFKFALPVD